MYLAAPLLKDWILRVRTHLACFYMPQGLVHSRHAEHVPWTSFLHAPYKDPKPLNAM